MDVIALVIHVAKNQRQTIENQKKSASEQPKWIEVQGKAIDDLIKRSTQLECRLQESK